MKPFLVPALALAAATLVPAVNIRQAAAAVYYLSPSGSDANAGTSVTAPWRTIGRVNAQVLRAGDRVLFQGGASFPGTLSFVADGVRNAGTATKPIVIGSYGTGRASIDAGSGDGISLVNATGFCIQNLVLNGAWDADRQSGNQGCGIRAFCDRAGGVKLAYLRIDKVEVRGFRDAGIQLGAWPADGSKSGFSNVRITNSSVHDNGDAGVTTWGYWDVASTSYAHQGVYIGRCDVYRNRGVADTGLHSGNGILVSDVDGATIERCIAHDNGDRSNWSYGGPVGVWAFDANRVVIQNNESFRNHSATLDGGGFDLDGGATNSVLQYNYSHDNDGSGFLMAQFDGARPFRGNVVRYNISENDGRRNGYAGIHFWNGGSGITDCDVYNNTVFISPAAAGTPRAVRVDSPTVNVRFFNNLLVATQGLPVLDVSGGQAALLFRGNAYCTGESGVRVRWAGETFTDLAAWQHATGQETAAGAGTALTGDPGLSAPGAGGTVGDADALADLVAYRLRADSPLRGAGLRLDVLFGISLGPTDFFGNPTAPGTPSVGAHLPVL